MASVVCSISYVSMMDYPIDLYPMNYRGNNITGFRQVRSESTDSLMNLNKIATNCDLKGFGISVTIIE